MALFTPELTIGMVDPDNNPLCERCLDRKAEIYIVDDAQNQRYTCSPCCGPNAIKFMREAGRAI